MFIKRETAIKAIDDYAQALYSQNDWKMGETADYCATLLENVPDEYVVRIEEWTSLNYRCNVLKALLMGEWVKCQDVLDALNITFDMALKMFQMGTVMPWNSSYEEGKDNISFRIGDKTARHADMQLYAEEFHKMERLNRMEEISKEQLELILEQQGGII
jgi:hypothetical protein